MPEHQTIIAERVLPCECRIRHAVAFQGLLERDAQDAIENLKLALDRQQARHKCAGLSQETNHAS